MRLVFHPLHSRIQRSETLWIVEGLKRVNRRHPVDHGCSSGGGETQLSLGNEASHPTPSRRRQRRRVCSERVDSMNHGAGRSHRDLFNDQDVGENSTPLPGPLPGECSNLLRNVRPRRHNAKVRGEEHICEPGGYCAASEDCRLASIPREVLRFLPGAARRHAQDHAYLASPLAGPSRPLALRGFLARLPDGRGRTPRLATVWLQSVGLPGLVGRSGIAETLAEQDLWLVETRGFEPLTPCVQSRCSPAELRPH